MLKVTKILISLMLLGMVCSVVLAQAVPTLTAPAVEWHGYIQNRFYAPESASARFAVERVSLSATAKLADNRMAYVEIYQNRETSTYLESAYFETPFGIGKLRVGKGRQLNFGVTPTYPNRKTTNYGILAEAFTQDRIIGTQWVVKQNKIDAGISVYNDLTIGNRSIGDFGGVAAADVVPHWAEREVQGTSSGRLAVSAKFGMVTPTFVWHISGMTGSLNDANLSDLNAAYDMESSNTDHNKYGADASYTNGKVYAGIEAYRQKFSFLTISGFGATAGYIFTDGNKAYVKYAKIDNSLEPTENSKTWEPTQWILAAVHPIAKNTWLEANYEINQESGGDIANNLFFVELFTGF